MTAHPFRPAADSFARAPFILFWETTAACDLACKHCRAEAHPRRDPDELDLEEGKALLDEAHEMGCRSVVLTGGDPAKREDLVDLVRYGSGLGLRMALTPSATPLVTATLLTQLRDAGLGHIAISLDGAAPRAHDVFRGLDGSWARTFKILVQALDLGLTTQVNTTVTRFNVDELETIALRLSGLNIELWNAFFVVPTGRATRADELDAETVELVLNRLANLSELVPFDITTTAAPHYRRVLLERKVARRHIKGIADGIGRAPRSLNDGQGIAFVARNGDIFPSGFMPVRCGNVREEGLTATYREHPLFRLLRDPDSLGGKCGACEFRRVCGGSRARAFAVHGDPMGEEPTCTYQPKNWSAA